MDNERPVRILLECILVCEKFHRRVPHEFIYGHKKKVHLKRNISIESFHALFYNCHYISIYVK